MRLLFILFLMGSLGSMGKQLRGENGTNNPTQIARYLSTVSGKGHDTAKVVAYIGLIELLATSNTDSALAFGDSAIKRIDRGLAVEQNKLVRQRYFLLRGEVLFNQGCLNHMMSYFEKAEMYYQQAIQVQQSINDKAGLSKSLNYYSRILERRGDNDAFFKVTSQALKIQQAIKDSNGIGLSLIAIGDHYNRIGNPDSSVLLYQNAVDLLRLTKSPERLSFALYTLGLTLSKKGEMEQATTVLFEALQIQETNNDRNGMINSLLAIGALYERMGEWDRAIDYFKRVIGYNKRIGNKAVESKVYSNLAKVYAAQGKHLESIAELEKCLGVLEKYQLGPGVISLCLNNIGKQYEEIGQLEKALNYLERSVKIGRGISLPQHTAERLTSTGSVYLKLNQPDKAKTYLAESLSISEQLGFPTNIKEATRLLAEVYEEEGNYSDALRFFKQYSAMKDSVESNKLQKILIEKEAQHAIEKQQQQVLLTERKVVLLQKEQQLSNYMVFGLIAGFLAISLIGVLLFANYNQRKNAQVQEIRTQLTRYLKEVNLLKANINTQLIEGRANIETMVNGEALGAYFETRLSKREMDVIAELSKGKSNKEIADALFVSVNTVRTHLLNIYEKLDVKNRTQAVKKAENLSLLKEA